jgi:hypothetical protein
MPPVKSEHVPQRAKEILLVLTQTHEAQPTRIGRSQHKLLIRG